MQKILKYKLLIFGIIMILAGAFLLAQANAKQAKCESLGGQIVKLFDDQTQQDCARVKTLQFLSYAGIALGVALVVAHFVKKQ